ncbi:cell division protein [Paenibacillus albidus]|uniref:cell division protein ZipA C-terminal FtsZ-binding domain-containing protein n=1 Tax=Paenibacillus albidus TaxID=2041023 RepID=UPI001BE90D81|nr:cell division protein ZipA C-terminal FtsZ-binding domain-containing protein [Paenibacillus albidus]MBT2292121.1 cell division protein [Paenibacillus albidus]
MHLPEYGSENAAYLLHVEREPEPVVQVGGIYVREPNPAYSWLIDVEFDGFTLADEDLLKLLKGYIVYGFVRGLECWTSVGRRAAGECHYTQICICANIFDNVQMEVSATEAELEALLTRIPGLFRDRGRVKVTPRESPAAAVGRAQQMLDGYEQEKAWTDEHELSVKLVAEPGKRYKGAEIWDVMLSLGLQWGDMDLFHAQNEGPDGDDYLFSIGTETEPGYFWPMTLAEDEFDNLLFSMNVVRTEEPQKVFLAMWRGVGYACSRLGGSLLNTYDEPATANFYLQSIKRTETRFGRRGITPGADLALFLF